MNQIKHIDEAVGQLAPETAARFGLTLLGVMTTSVLGAYVLTALYRVRPPEIVNTFSILFFAGLLSTALLGVLGCVAWLGFRGEREPIRKLREMPCWSAQFIWTRAAPVMITMVFLGSCGTYKAMIPYINPFWADALFSNADRLMFGTDPWRLTHALIGQTGTRILDIIYGLWFPAWVFTLIYFGCFAQESEQRRFLTAFYLVWIFEGIVLATFLSSVGPVYLKLIHNPDAVRYVGLFPIDAPGAARAQSMLAASYLNGSVGAFKGISAMPSLHVGIAALLVLAWQRQPLLFGFAIVFWILVSVASVHLGWHYAVDGIVASISSALIWYVCGQRQLRGGQTGAG